MFRFLVTKDISYHNKEVLVPSYGTIIFSENSHKNVSNKIFGWIVLMKFLVILDQIAVLCKLLLAECKNIYDILLLFPCYFVSLNVCAFTLFEHTNTILNFKLASFSLVHSQTNFRLSSHYNFSTLKVLLVLINKFKLKFLKT